MKWLSFRIQYLIMDTFTPFKVSVITPVYNAEISVERAVLSALSQPEVEEIILVEDQSPDRALEICKQLQARHPDQVRVFQHPDKRNHGAGPSRNLGIKQACCPFIAFLDADDYYLPGRFQRDAEIFTTDQSADGVYSALGTDIQDEAGRKWFSHSGRPELTTLHPAPAPEHLFFWMAPIGLKGYFSLDTLTLRSSRIPLSITFSDLKLAQDTLFSLQIAAQCRLLGAQTGQPVAMRGVHARNRIQDSSRSRDVLDAVLAQLMVWAMKEKLPESKIRAIERACLQSCTGWSDVFGVLRQYPKIRGEFKTWFALLRWAAIRRYPEDPFLPGLRWRRIRN